jgi:hypothetical protein
LNVLNLAILIILPQLPPEQKQPKTRKHNCFIAILRVEINTAPNFLPAPSLSTTEKGKVILDKELHCSLCGATANLEPDGELPAGWKLVQCNREDGCSGHLLCITHNYRTELCEERDAVDCSGQ